VDCVVEQEVEMRFIARRAAVSRRALCLVGIAALVAVPVAAAHFVYTSGNYVRGPICVSGGSGIAEGPPQVIAEGWTQAFGQGVCLTAKNVPAYHLALRRHLYRWNGSSWALCANSGWVYNTSPTSYKSIWRQWAQMPCGGGWYDHLGESWAYYNGQWLGGARWAGNHYF
jgi:hypothetical protein